MGVKLMYIPNDDTHYHSFCRLKLMVETFDHSKAVRLKFCGSEGSTDISNLNLFASLIIKIIILAKLYRKISQCYCKIFCGYCATLIWIYYYSDLTPDFHIL